MPEKLHTALLLEVAADAKVAHYCEVLNDIKAVLQDEDNWVAAMATGFYCVWPASPETLLVGPYQGTLGCCRIPFTTGVCGAAASSKNTQLVPNVHDFPGHIACASSTQSEIVVPIISPSSRKVVAVLDVDSNYPAAFDSIDQQHLERLCGWLADRYHSG